MCLVAPGITSTHIVTTNLCRYLCTARTSLISWRQHCACELELVRSKMEEEEPDSPLDPPMIGASRVIRKLSDSARKLSDGARKLSGAALKKVEGLFGVLQRG